MTSLLARDSYDARSVEVRRLVVLTIAVVVLAGAWHGLKGTLIRTFGAASFGCGGREKLIVAALEEAGVDVPADCWAQSWSLPRPGWVTWWSAFSPETPPSDSSRELRRWTHVADGHLKLLGKFAADIGPPPMDIDGDGAWEVRMTPLASTAGPNSPVEYQAVLRLHATANELIWLGLVDNSTWRARRMSIRSIWKDTDGDGIQELVYIAIATTRSPTGRPVYKLSETIASFKLDRPGGILRPETLLPDCGITPWDPPNGEPVTIDQAADLSREFQRLLPLADKPGK